jgi:hypothetical protein
MPVHRMDDHETAAADVAGARIGHRHGKAGGDCRIDRVAAASQDVGTDPGCNLFLRHHHAVFGWNGMHGIGSERRIETAARLLRDGETAERENKQARGKDFPPRRLERSHQTFSVEAKVPPRHACYMAFDDGDKRVCRRANSDIRTMVQPLV